MIKSIDMFIVDMFELNDPIYIYIYIDLLLRHLLISELRDADDRVRHPKSVVLVPNTAKKSFHFAK